MALRWKSESELRATSYRTKRRAPPSQADKIQHQSPYTFQGPGMAINCSSIPFSPFHSIHIYLQERFRRPESTESFFPFRPSLMLSFNSHIPQTNRLSSRDLDTAISLATMLNKGQGTEFTDAYDNCEEPFNPAIKTAINLLTEDPSLLHDLKSGRSGLKMKENEIEASGTAFRDALRPDSPVSCKSLIALIRRIVIGINEPILPCIAALF